MQIKDNKFHVSLNVLRYESPADIAAGKPADDITVEVLSDLLLPGHELIKPDPRKYVGTIDYYLKPFETPDVNAIYKYACQVTKDDPCVQVRYTIISVNK